MEIENSWGGSWLIRQRQEAQHMPSTNKEHAKSPGMEGEHLLSATKKQGGESK